MLSSGLSDFSFNHGDVGGYTAIGNPLKDYHRSKELFMRWTELGAFTTVLRTHEGNRPEANHQIYSDGETLRHFSRLAKVYAAWGPYREELVEEAGETGLPVVRHPLLHYWDDPEVYGLRYQLMVGSEFMVAPVLDPGEDTVEAYLPAGRWIHLWTGETYGSVGRGSRVIVGAPIGEPAVFYKEGSAAGRRFREELALRGLLERSPAVGSAAGDERLQKGPGIGASPAHKAAEGTWRRARRGRRRGFFRVMRVGPWCTSSGRGRSGPVGRRNSIAGRTGSRGCSVLVRTRTSRLVCLRIITRGYKDS
jgi:hypothetical protein